MLKKMKVIALLLSVVMCATMFAGCGTPTEEEREIIITIGNWPTRAGRPTDFELYEQYKKDFMEKYPNIGIRTDEWAWTPDTFLPRAEAGTLPNMYRVTYTEPGKIIRSGYALDITDYLVEHKYDQYLNPAALNIVTRDGRYYGIPHTGYMVGMTYNVAIIREAGLVDENDNPIYPETYEELIEWGKIIRENTGHAAFGLPTQGGWGGWQFMQIAWAFGVNFMEEQADGSWLATFNTPEAIAAFEYYRDLRWKHNLLPEHIVLIDRDELSEILYTGRLAAIYGGAGEVPPRVFEYGIKIEDMGWGPVPAGPAGRYAQFGGDIYMFSQQTTPEQLEACIKWINFIGLGPEMDENLEERFTERLMSQQASGYGLQFAGAAYDVWNNPERDVLKPIQDRFANVVKEQVRPMLDETVTLRPEEPLYAQELYVALSDIMQAILLDENADIPALLERANNNFQSDFLDRI